jgi:glycosyltransferase involved in cell wall biosynthesis
MSELGIVVIGRNEGERLHRCLNTVAGQGFRVVYVDSGSTDGSVEAALAQGAEVVELDRSRPFTAARARNAGFARLGEIDSEVRFVQFVDGDCELVAGWLEQAHQVIKNRPEVAVVCGRCRERFPERSIYHRLADLEWDLPLGETKACGGIAMFRAAALQEVGAFDPAIIAAEDDELCVRIRKCGWKLIRIDAEMVLHDIAMTRFSQWWRRNVRCGHAYAEGCERHGRAPERHFVHQVRSTVFWGLLVPFLALGLAWPTRGASLALLCGYVLLYWRILRYGTGRGWQPRNARLYAIWCVLAKFPTLVGLVVYCLRRVVRRPRQIIEYKQAERDARKSNLSTSIVGD